MTRSKVFLIQSLLQRCEQGLRGSAIFLLFLSSSFAGLPVVVTTLDGNTRVCEMIGIEPTVALKISIDGRTQALPLSEVFSVEFRTPSAANFTEESRDFVVLTNWAGRLSTTSLETADGQLKFDTPLLGNVTLPLTSVQGIHRPGLNIWPTARRGLAKAMASQPTQDDLLIEKDGGAVSLVGLFKGIHGNRFLFRWQETDREIDVAKILALALASATDRPKIPKDFVGILSVHSLANDGSGGVLPGKLAAISSHDLTLDSPLVGTVKIAYEKIAALDFVFGRRVYLSDFTPTDARETSFFGHSFGWQRDASVEGRPMRLQRGGRTEEFAKGVGTHTRCELTYPLMNKFRVLVGLIGIDEETKGRGSANFVVLADGREIFRSGEIKAADEARWIFVPLTGAKTVTLRTDFIGKDFDIGAHADWANLQLIE